LPTQRLDPTMRCSCDAMFDSHRLEHSLIHVPTSTSTSVNWRPTASRRRGSWHMIAFRAIRRARKRPSRLRSMAALVGSLFFRPPCTPCTQAGMFQMTAIQMPTNVGHMLSLKQRRCELWLKAKVRCAQKSQCTSPGPFLYPSCGGSRWCPFDLQRGTTPYARGMAACRSSALAIE